MTNFSDLTNNNNNFNVPNTTLLNTIHVERGIIPANLCDFIVQDTERREWKPHTWYNSQADTYGSEETKELDVQSDHIHSIFDGKEKGIPVLSFILNFNDDYEGADLFFWDNTTFKLGKGDIIMWPSNFLYPHGVTEAISGKRYSGVTWAW